MAAVKGVNVTLYDAGGQGDNAVDQGLIHTEQEVWTDEYEASALATASTIDIAVLPAGAKVQSIEVYHDDMGTAVTISIGDSTSAARYLAATTVASAGKLTSNLVDGVNYVIGTNSGDEVIKLTTAGTQTGTLKSVVRYTR